MSGTITDALLRGKDRPTIYKAVQFKKNKTWKSLNWMQYYQLIERAGKAMAQLEVGKGTPVGILSDTRLEWSVVDFATLGLGGVSVPLYANNHAEDIEFIVNNSGIKILFCESKEHLNLWLQIKDKCPSVTHVVAFDPIDIDSKDALSWQDFLGLAAEKSQTIDFAKSCLENTLDQVATIIYTSGTTGRPKGVVLTHNQIMSEVIDIFDLFNIDEDDITLSFLPYAHIFGRVEHWGAVYAGYCIAYAESIDKVRVNLNEINPTFMIAVPRIYEKIYNAVINQVEAHPSKKKIFYWALRVGQKVSQHKSNKEPLPLLLLAQYVTAKKLVFDKIIAKLGGKLRFAISGGAPLSSEIAQFFHAAGLLILEGYGLTETSAGIFINTPLNYSFGTVGKAIGDVEIKFEKDGEILVRSDKVMKEYFKDTEATQEVFDPEGFFRTGDIGELSKDGFLKITDRKKDLIKTAGGKYVAPQKLENILKMSPYISNVHIHGDRKKYIIALVTLDPDGIASFANAQDISYKNVEELATNHDIKALIRDAVAEANSQVASYESVKTFAILESDFTVESGELTPSLKVKRKVIDQKFADTINKLYGNDKSAM